MLIPSIRRSAQLSVACAIVWLCLLLPSLALAGEAPAFATQPVLVRTNITWKAVAAGLYRSLAVRADGTLWWWGYYAGHQPQPLGTNAAWETPAAALGNAANLAAVRADGTLWVWGVHNGSLLLRTQPVPLGKPFRWRGMAVGASHTLALRSDGTLWSWGEDFHGQRGDGPANHRLTKSSRVVGNGVWQSLAAGYFHNVALRADGTLWTWGNNEYGQLGLGDYSGRNQPVQPISNSTWRAVSAGGLHTVAVRTDGTLWTWGDNYWGQLGVGSSQFDLHVPVPVAGAWTWRTVAAGGTHTMAVRADGTLWAWGGNAHGQLGDGTMESRNQPVLIGADTTWQTVAAGESHTLAVRSDGTLWAWGNNDHGQLGLGTDEP